MNAEVEKLYRETLRSQPNDIAVMTDLARLLQKSGRLDEAVALFRRVAELKPDLPLALQNLGIALCEQGALEESFAVFRRHAEVAYAALPVSSANAPPQKRQHDLEQKEYRNGDESFYIDKGERVAGQAIKAHPDTAAKWHYARPQIVVVDDFLTVPALEKLRRYCMASTIWRQVYEAGYLGAMPEYGLGSPLLAQIAEELRSAYSEILGNHPLLHFWAFKYANRHTGVAVHADFAAVNINFWITPDDANLDPHSGGLIVWDKPAPLDWDFEKYNDDVDAARHFLKQSGAKAITIPYRANRAVIFNSNLFHETDKMNFKEGYQNRRINLTLLYGRR